MEEKREKQFWRIICCLLPLCLFLVWVNILPVSAQTQLSASAQIQSAAPWGTETVKETRAYYDGAYWRVPNGWYHYQPTEDGKICRCAIRRIISQATMWQSGRK